MTEIQKRLFELQDEKYRDFQVKLIPTVDPATVIGVRTPELRKLAKELSKRDDIDAFLETLPHDHFDENQLHAFILSGMKDFTKCMTGVCGFLPFIDNWATCDQLSPKVFGKNKAELLAYINEWLQGYLEIGLNGDFAETFVRLATKAEKDRVQWEKVKQAELARIAARTEAKEAQDAPKHTRKNRKKD